MRKPKQKSSTTVKPPGRASGGGPKEWQLQDAKARFSEVFRLARESGPQRVTKHGREAVVMIAAEDYERISKAKASQGSLVKFFAESPLAGSGIDLDRPLDIGRPIDL